MRKLFYVGVALLVLFEVANVYFIMPMPGSQRMASVEFAYRLYGWRWVFRVICGVMIVAGLLPAFRAPGWRRAVAPVVLIAGALIVYATNFVMAAEQMFIAPARVNMQPASSNTVDNRRLVVGVEIDGEARAYPIQFIGYHHQVRDSVAGKPVLVSYCTVCRTGRVFNPVVDGKAEAFRLVGMDHFNAMFEDASTGSWWRQASGEAIVGPSKGKVLEEFPSQQVTLAQWLALHPASLIMQPDSALASKYTASFDYETGASTSTLTGTDTTSWGEKSWVVGITLDGVSKAFDWNRLRRERVVNDFVGVSPVVVAIAQDGVSYFAFMRPDSATRFTLRNDSLVAGASAYALTGRGDGDALTPVKASQEFWHSWRTFQPATTRY